MVEPSTVQNEEIGYPNISTDEATPLPKPPALFPQKLKKKKEDECF